jgi:hypothetical protein
MSRDMMRNCLGGFIAGSFIGALAALYLFPVPDGNKDLIVFMLGQLSGFMGAVISYNFGTSKSSADKNAVIAGMADTATGKVDDPLHVQDDTMGPRAGGAV